MIWIEISQGWTNVVNSTIINNPRTKRRKKFSTRVCCCVGRNDRDLIRDIVTGFRLSTNNVWYCSGVKLICWEYTSNLEPSWFCWLLCFLIFKLELKWKIMFSITCINHMSCLSTTTADFRSISSFVTSSVSINHFFWMIIKKLSLLMCTKRTNPMFFGSCRKSVCQIEMCINALWISNFLNY